MNRFYVVALDASGNLCHFTRDHIEDSTTEPSVYLVLASPIVHPRQGTPIYVGQSPNGLRRNLEGLSGNGNCPYPWRGRYQNQELGFVHFVINDPNWDDMHRKSLERQIIDHLRTRGFQLESYATQDNDRIQAPPAWLDEVLRALQQEYHIHNL